MAEHPTLTLAVPYYSRPDFLRKTVASIAGQTYRRCEALIVDDSPRGLEAADCAELEQLLAGRMKLRRIRTHGAQGMAYAWNRCIDEARTDLVALIHGDDELEPRYAETVSALAARHPRAAAVFCGAKIIGEDSRDAFSFPDWYKDRLIPPHIEELHLSGDSALQALLRGNYIFCPTLCYRSSAVRGVRFDPQYRFVLDFDFVTRLLLGGGSFVGIPRDRLYRYRRHENNATSQLTRELTRFREEALFYARTARQASEAGFVRAEAVARTAQIIQLNLCYSAVRDALRGEFRAAGGKLKLLGQLRRDVRAQCAAAETAQASPP